MNFKNILIISLFLLLILTIESVSATVATNDTTNFNLQDEAASGDNGLDDTLSSTKDMSISENTDTEKIENKDNDDETTIKGGNSETSFASLTDEINKESKNLTLKHDYTYNKLTDSKFINGIKINKDFTIYGNGKTIDAKGKSRIFNVIKGATLIIENLNLINCNAEYGGAIYVNNNCKLTITASTFINTTTSNQGGAIYITNGHLNIKNSTFINTTTSNQGGAIYITDSYMNIIDSKFINNTAYSYGGVIAYENYEKHIKTQNIQRIQIINSTSIDDAGGAIYLKHVTLNMDDVNITSSKANFGGSITSLNTKLKISNCNIVNSTAKYDGGGIYHMYGSLSINKSKLLTTNGENGGAIYLSLSENSEIIDNKFSNNHANNEGNVIYLVLNENTLIKENTYNNQIKPMSNDLCEISDILRFISNGNYTLYHVNVSDNEKLQDKYDLRDYGYVTPVKDQKDSGNCWAFNAIGVLESAILKADGESLDLSEENIKNLMASYSIYGWEYETNIDGGFNYMSFGYLTSWLGPVYEYEDLYNDSSTLSPVLNSLMHIQNIAYITRKGATDNKGIKEALVKYGALGTNMHMDNQYPYLTEDETSYYYDGDEDTDHAVVIVGWDDKYSKYNFEKTPPSDGAWIVKNSWGTEWGENGYFYVSYYDTQFARETPISAYAFILNDTIKYDKNYQYDIQGPTDYLLNSANTVWYKNVFNSTDNEYLSAVSTYFQKDTAWELTIKVNNIIRNVQSGSSKAGYYTINLNQLIPLNIGDIFEVIYKITVDKKATIPVSEGDYMNVRSYKENTSFLSYDGVKWRDLYELRWEDDRYYHTSQVACIKAFTILNPVNTKLILNIQNITESTVDLIATIYTEYGYLLSSGNVTFTIGDKQETVAVKDGIAKLNTLITGLNVSAKFEETGYNSSTDTKLIPNTLVPTKIDLSIISNNAKVNISAYITNLDYKAIKSGFVVFNDGIKNYTANVVNGFANLTNIFLNAGENNVTAIYQDPSHYYKTSNKTITTNISAIKTKIIAYDTAIYKNEEYQVTLNDEYDNPLPQEEIILKINEKTYKSQTNEKGIAKFTLNLDTKTYTAIIEFQGTNNYLNSTTTKEISIKQPENTKTNTTNKTNINTIQETTPPNITQTKTKKKTTKILAKKKTYKAKTKTKKYSITLTSNKTPLKNLKVTLKIGKKTYKAKTNKQGKATFKITKLNKKGKYTAKITYKGNNKYTKSTKTIKLTIKE